MTFYATKLFPFFFLLAVASFRGEVLKLTKIARNEMGSYLCIASNSVPPSVSKRISLNIHCEYFVKTLVDITLTMKITTAVQMPIVYLSIIIKL